MAEKLDWRGLTDSLYAGRHSDNISTQIVYMATRGKSLELLQQYNVFIIPKTVLMF
jgi:hypothetical protein